MSLSTVDWGHIQDLTEGDVNFEAELLSLFIQHTESQLHTLHLAWEIRDFKRLAQVAHQLRSSCGTIGACTLYRLMTDLENCAAIQKETDLEWVINALRPTFAEIVDEIDQYRRQTFSEDQCDIE